MIPVQITQLSTNKNPIHLTLDVGWVEKYKTVTGNPIVISDGVKDTLLKKLQMTLAPKQFGSGTPSPSNVRPISGWDEVETHKAGKNLLPYPYALTSGTVSGITYTVLEDGSVSISGTATATAYINLHPRTNMFVLKAGTYTVSGASGSSIVIVIGDSDNVAVGATSYQPTFTLTKDTNVFAFIQIASGTVVDITLHPQIEIGSTATSYEPYDGQTITTPLPTTVYGGTVDVVSGVLTVTHGYISSYNGETINEPWISDRDEYVAGTTPTTGAQVVYELVTPTTIQCDQQTVSLLAGENVIMGDGDMEITYRVKASA